MIRVQLREMKEKCGYSNKKIAELSGVSLPTVNRIMSGQTDVPNFQTVCDLVIAMGGSLDELAGIPPKLTVQDEGSVEIYKGMIREKDCFIYRCEKSPSDFIPNSSHTGLTLNFSEFKKAEGDVKTLAMYFCDSYERSGATGAALELRGTLALKWYDFITQNT